MTSLVYLLSQLLQKTFITRLALPVSNIDKMKEHLCAQLRRYMTSHFLGFYGSSICYPKNKNHGETNGISHHQTQKHRFRCLTTSVSSVVVVDTRSGRRQPRRRWIDGLTGEGLHRSRIGDDYGTRPNGVRGGAGYTIPNILSKPRAGDPIANEREQVLQSGRNFGEKQ